MKPRKQKVSVIPLFWQESPEFRVTPHRSVPVARMGQGGEMRRGATPDSKPADTPPSTVAPRRKSCRSDPWTKVHGYPHPVAPRLQKKTEKHSAANPLHVLELILICFQDECKCATVCGWLDQYRST